MVTLLRCLSLLALLLCCGLPLPAAAQTGSVSGVVVDAETGETLIGASVVLRGTTTGATTDLDGRYEIPGLAPAAYDLVFSFIGYQVQTVRGVQVRPGQATRVDLGLPTETLGLAEVVVEAAAVRNAEAALLRERQKAAAVSDAISAEAIARSGSGTAADALQKVTGASIVGGRYVYVRGLGDRYLNTQLNGATLPSADPEQNAVPLDLFPSGLLDHIITTKTFTPDQPGSFTGGSVNIGTRDYPERLSFSLSSSMSFNTAVGVGGDYLTFDGGAPGFFGLRTDGFAVPDAVAQAQIPSISEANVSREKAVELDRLSKAFSSVMAPRVGSAPVGQSYGLSMGNQVALFGRPLGFIGSLSYSRSVAGYDGGTSGRYRIAGSVAQAGGLLADYRLADRRGADEVLWGGMAKLTYRLHPRHELGLNYLQNRSAESAARYQAGTNSNYSGGGEADVYETRTLQFTERALRTLQASGSHAVSARNVRLEWNSTYSTTRQDEPDVRLFANNYSTFDGDTAFAILQSLYPAPTRYFRTLEENAWVSNASVSVPLRQWSGLPAQLKAGGTYERKDRTFRERQFTFAQDVRRSLYEGDADAYFGTYTGLLEEFSTATFNRFGLYVRDDSQPRNNYDGDYDVAAGFAMVDLPLTRRLRFIGGARYEVTQMTTTSRDERLEAGTLDNRDLLPSASLLYQVVDDMNLRLAYGRTLARPTFRELAPYSSFSFIGDYIFTGNPALERTLIDNFDARWEWFARPGEIAALSGFYKGFTHPIERVILNDNGEVQYQNVERATVYGVEVELRKRLDAVAPFLAAFQVGANLTLTRSAVEIAPDELEVIRAYDPAASGTRALQGQSPFVFNADVGYDHAGTTVSLYYNVFGQRLSEVSLGGTPDVYEAARGDLDLVLARRLGMGFRLKASVKNLLDDDYRLVQTFKDETYVVRAYDRGRSYAVGVTYSLD